jgi:hypothetical protein
MRLAKQTRYPKPLIGYALKTRLLKVCSSVLSGTFESNGIKIKLKIRLCLRICGAGII